MWKINIWNCREACRAVPESRESRTPRCGVDRTEPSPGRRSTKQLIKLKPPSNQHNSLIVFVFSRPELFLLIGATLVYISQESCFCVSSHLISTHRPTVYSDKTPYLSWIAQYLAGYMPRHLKTLLPSELDDKEIKMSTSVLLSGHLWEVESLLLHISEKTVLLKDTNVLLDLDVFPCGWKEWLLMQFWKKLIRFMQASISLWLAFRWGCSYMLQEILVCAFSVYFHYLMCAALGWERQKWLFGRFLSTCKFISLSCQKNQTYYFFITQFFWMDWCKMPSEQLKALNQSFVVLLGTDRTRYEEPVFPKKIPSHKKYLF